LGPNTRFEVTMSTILCIDDRREFLALRRTTLESVGYSVLTAQNGRAGLDLLATNKVDAVILDYKMEGMDGLAVARGIKRCKPSLPIVLLCGYHSDVPGTLADIADACVAKGHAGVALLQELQRFASPPRQPKKRSLKQWLHKVLTTDEAA
jgi:CheY-like chemotaxis protein